jgi:RecJ-like exonuclease
MNVLRLSTGYEVPLDGDLLAVLEALYREVTLKRQFNGSFEDMMREIEGLVAQMSPEDRHRYLVESLFLNYNTYESEVLDAYARKLTAKKKPRGRASGGPR